MPKLPNDDLGTWQACMWSYVPSSFVAYWDREGRGIDIYSPPSGGPGIQQTCKLAYLCQHIVALWYGRYGNRHVKLVHGNSGTWQVAIWWCWDTVDFQTDTFRLPCLSLVKTGYHLEILINSKCANRNISQNNPKWQLWDRAGVRMTYPCLHMLALGDEWCANGWHLAATCQYWYIACMQTGEHRLSYHGPGTLQTFKCISPDCHMAVLGPSINVNRCAQVATWWH